MRAAYRLSFIPTTGAPLDFARGKLRPYALQPAPCALSMWPLYALIAAVTAALMTIVGKMGLKQVDPTLATGVRSLFMFLFMALVVLLTGKLQGVDRLDRNAMLTIALSAVFGALSWLFYFLALKDGSANKVSAIDRTSIVFVILLSALFLAEKLTWKAGAGGLLIAIGAILVAF